LVTTKRTAKKTSTPKQVTPKKPATKNAAARPPAKSAVKSPVKRPVVVAKAPPPATQPDTTVKKYAQLARLWLVETGVQTVGLWVNEHVWTGNDNGECFKLEKDTGAIAGSWLLPRGCVAVVSDDAWTYAGCANGCVYDLTGSTAQVAYQLGGANHDWLEVNQGVLCVSDDKGTVSVIDVDGSIRWQKSDRKAREGWVLRTAADGLYHGSLVGLRKYDWGGKLRWAADPGDVRFGVIDGDEVFVTADFTRSSGETKLACIDRVTGEVRWRVVLHAGQPDFDSGGAEACAVVRDARGQRLIYAAVGGYVFCLDDQGAYRWYAPTDCDALCNMVVRGDRLFFASCEGTIGVAEVSDAALAKIDAGQWPAVKPLKQARLTAKSAELKRTRHAGKGVIVECVKERSKLRVRVVSPGYNSEWFCQFPRDLREDGARYVVDEVREAAQGGFYRALGEIKRLDDS
jgi:hypothetical protein